MTDTDAPARVSAHGGHSGQFCSHAHDQLEDIVLAYIDRGFSWFGVTEHMPPDRDEMVLPEEARLGMSAADNLARFTDYIATCRSLQKKYADRITLYTGFETEAFEGYQPWLRHLLDTFKPDYIVGSVHHVQNMLIDSTPERYQEAARQAGGVEALYYLYFDQQYDLITTFSPAVVGHFDLVRIFDPDYRTRLARPGVWSRIQRNLDAIKDLGLIMDFNLRALFKKQPEPYISRPILQRVCEMGIPVAPGDDSHGVDGVGLFWDEGIRILKEVGMNLNWKRPT